MKTYSVPVIHTTVGWIEIKAETHAEAVAEACRLNEEGVELFSLEDSESHSEVIVSELQEMG